MPSDSGVPRHPRLVFRHRRAGPRPGWWLPQGCSTHHTAGGLAGRLEHFRGGLGLAYVGVPSWALMCRVSKASNQWPSAASGAGRSSLASDLDPPAPLTRSAGATPLQHRWHRTNWVEERASRNSSASLRRRQVSRLCRHDHTRAVRRRATMLSVHWSRFISSHRAAAPHIHQGMFFLAGGVGQPQSPAAPATTPRRRKSVKPRLLAYYGTSLFRAVLVQARPLPSTKILRGSISGRLPDPAASPPPRGGPPAEVFELTSSA